jgi:hypothetical protein
MLTSLTVDLNAETRQAEVEADSWRPEDVAPPTEALENDADLEPPADTSLPIGISTGEKVADASQLPTDLVTELAQQCVDTEWWEAGGAR